MVLPPDCHKCTSGFQIPPQEDDYGFDLEEKNKAVVVKSVQRGSLAEVRPTGGHSGGMMFQLGVSPCLLRRVSSAGSELQGSGDETAFLACSTSATCWASGDMQGKQKAP